MKRIIIIIIKNRHLNTRWYFDTKKSLHNFIELDLFIRIVYYWVKVIRITTHFSLVRLGLDSV